MGYDIARFESEVDEELICPICSGVLEEPLHVSTKKNSFFIVFDNVKYLSIKL